MKMPPLLSSKTDPEIWSINAIQPISPLGCKLYEKCPFGKRRGRKQSRVNKLYTPSFHHRDCTIQLHIDYLLVQHWHYLNWSLSLMCICIFEGDSGKLLFYSSIFRLLIFAAISVNFLQGRKSDLNCPESKG